MLRNCASGYEIIEKPHKYCVRYGGKTYPSLPKGDHGSGSRAEIQVGHVRNMIRHLNIDLDCANSYLPVLNLNPRG
jgi:hypothetical protein